MLFPPTVLDSTVFHKSVKSMKNVLMECNAVKEIHVLWVNFASNTNAKIDLLPMIH